MSVPPSSKTLLLGDAITRTTKMFTEVGITAARFEAELILEFILKRDRHWLITNQDTMLSLEEITMFETMVEKRFRHVPLSYLIGTREFMSLEFKTTADVLIPRPETELLVETCLQWIGERSELHGCDIGTGSGCIPLSIIHHAPGDVQMLATDISPAALEIAQYNAKHLKCLNKINFVAADLFDGVETEKPFDFITANLPYISSDEYKDLMLDVREYEPILALWGGETGLEIISRFIRDVGNYLLPKGLVIVEIGYTQANEVRQMFHDTHMFEKISVLSDYNNHDRCVSAIRNTA